MSSSKCYIFAITKRFAQRRTPFGKVVRDFEEKNRPQLDAHPGLRLAQRIKDRPEQFEILKLKKDIKEKRYVESSKEPLPLHKEMPPYHRYKDEDIARIQSFGTYYDPLFNPKLHEERYRVNPDEEPFKAIYIDDNSAEYTETRNVTTPQLWSYVESLERIKIAPKPRFRKPHEPIEPMPSGFYPPPEQYPDLPYAVIRTRNYLLPLYYKLDRDPEKCTTLINRVTGDLWELEHDVRTYLEEMSPSKARIITSVKEPEGSVLFREST